MKTRIKKETNGHGKSVYRAQSMSWRTFFLYEDISMFGNFIGEYEHYSLEDAKDAIDAFLEKKKTKHLNKIVKTEYIKYP
jgi:hypothetical protein